MESRHALPLSRIPLEPKQLELDLPPPAVTIGNVRIAADFEAIISGDVTLGPPPPNEPPSAGLFEAGWVEMLREVIEILHEAWAALPAIFREGMQMLLYTPPRHATDSPRSESYRGRRHARRKPHRDHGAIPRRPSEPACFADLTVAGSVKRDTVTLSSRPRRTLPHVHRLP